MFIGIRKIWNMGSVLTAERIRIKIIYEFYFDFWLGSQWNIYVEKVAIKRTINMFSQHIDHMR